MNIKQLAGLLALGFALSGCATIIAGTGEYITVNTNPDGATCTLNRMPEGVIGQINNTPAGVVIQKTKYDITIKCNKAGYQEATYLNHSGVEEATFGNIVLGGAAGWGVDSATGSDNKYDSLVNVTLIPSPREELPPAPVTGQRACTEQERVQKRIAIMNNYTLIPNCQ